MPLAVAGGLYALVAIVAAPPVLVAILLANSLVLSAFCRATGFDLDTPLPRSLVRRGLPYFILSTLYAAFVAALVAVPAWWLASSSSLPAALTISGVLVIAALALWRTWPAFVLPFLWDDAYPDQGEPGSWLTTSLRRSLAFAWHLTREPERFLADGLPASLGMLLLSAGALLLAGFAPGVGSDLHVAITAFYALVLSPAAHALLLNRSLHALLADARRRRARIDDDAQNEPQQPMPTTVPEIIHRDDLDATLLCAARSLQIDLALAALERGASPDAVPAPDQRDQRSALMIAVTLPDIRLLRALIAKGGDLNAAQGGITPLIAATRDSYEGRPDAVTMLLANGADARLSDAAGNTPLHHAARGADAVIPALLIDAGADPDAVNAEGLTPLAVACGNANWAIAEFLLARGARPTVPFGQPALVHAAGVEDDDPAGVRLLLRRKADVNALAPLQRTALMTAALAGHAAIAEALLAAGADVDARDQNGTTALMEAARSGAAAVIHALAKRKPTPDCVDASGRTALMIACQSRQANEETVRALLALGADRALTGNDGRRAIDHAIAAGRWRLVALLDPDHPLPANVSTHDEASDEISAEHLVDALRFGHRDVVSRYERHIGQWPRSTLAGIYVELSDPGLGAARAWLLNHGLDPDAATPAGEHLLDALVARLPESEAALVDLLQRGAPVGGAGLVARVLAIGVTGESAHHAIASLLLDRGADWFGRMADGRTCLHLAAEQGREDWVERLLALGADPDARDAQGRTPLHCAARLAEPEGSAIARRLVAAGANPEIASTVGETPLGIALARTDRAISQWLAWNDWKLPHRPLRGSDLVAAASVGDTVAVQRLLALGLPADAVDDKGATALIRASGSGHAALVVQLLEAGADVTPTTHSGMHCLGAAVGAGREAIVRTLLSHDVPADLRLAGGATPLMLAAALGQAAIVDALLEAGADPNAADEAGLVPLHAAPQYAFAGGKAAIARRMYERLLRAGGRLDARNADGQDALLIQLGARAQPGTHCDAETIRNGVECLLEHGADVAVQDRRGVGVLHACAMHGLLGCTRLLKSHGAPVDLRDAFDRTAADVASLLGYVDVATELGAGTSIALPGVRQTLRRPARAPD